MSSRTLFLIGFMGTGKSAVGREVARKTGFKLIDSDREIEKAKKKTIPEIFAQEGEAAFRLMEWEFIENCPTERTIISCGGGLAVQPGMMDLLKKKGVVVCLQASVETILARTRNSDRPLLAVKNPEERIRSLLLAREPFYKQAGNVIMTDSRPLNKIAGHVIRILKADLKR